MESPPADLAWLGEADCDDDRYPRLAGEWVVWCASAGRVDRATHLLTGAEVRLDAGTAPGVGPGEVYAVGGGHWTLPEAAPAEAVPWVRPGPIAPPAVGGGRVAVLYADHVEHYRAGDRSRTHVDAHPLPWYPPALAAGAVAWVERTRETGEDVWLAGDDRAARVLAGGPGDQRHVVGDGDWLAWVEPGAVVLHHLPTGAQTRFAADTGFRAPPTLSDGVVCWEERAALLQGGDVDLVCSDGWTLRRPGDQRSPSRHRGWLLFHEGPRAMVYEVDPMSGP